MNQNELQAIETRIQQLRTRAFDGTPAEQDAIHAQIVALKTQAAPEWDKRSAARESAYARVMWM